MVQYYAAPVVRRGRALYVNPLSGGCVVADSLNALPLCLGNPSPSDLYAVWRVGQGNLPVHSLMSLPQAAELCSRVPAWRMYVYLDEDMSVPLALDPATEVIVEAPHAYTDR